MSLLTRRAVAPFRRMTAPAHSCCKHCGTPWAYVAPHPIEVDSRSSFFFACEACWPLLTPAQKLSYAAELVHGSGSGWRRNDAWDFRAADEALMALVLGLMRPAPLAALEPVVVVADPARQPAPSEGVTTTTVRTWQISDVPDPGPDILAVRDVDGDLWRRCGDHWHVRSRRSLDRGASALDDGPQEGWNVVMSYAPLTDATGEVTP